MAATARRNLLLEFEWEEAELGIWRTWNLHTLQEDG